MKNMKVMNQRVDTNELGGMACGPFGMDVACAEMHIKDETGEKYLTLCWVSEAAESLEFDITTLPIFEYLLSDDLDEDEMAELDERRGSEGEYLIETAEDYDGPYVEQLKEMARMLVEKMKEAEMLDEDTFDDPEDVWAWISELAEAEF